MFSEKNHLLGDAEPVAQDDTQTYEDIKVHKSYGTTENKDLNTSTGSGFDSISISQGAKFTKSDVGPLPKADQLTLSWHNVNVYAKEKSKDKKLEDARKDSTMETGLVGKKHILRDVYGCVAPGQLMAIMGSSGAGKTTMLNVLTKRNLSELEVSGLVQINGEEVNKKQLQLCSAYVQQEDLFIPTLTVFEHLKFHAILRMGRHSTPAERRQRVEEVIAELSLTKCQHSIIGKPDLSSGISGGERKRLAFASELLTNPSLMFCDEPTSGLDSFMAFNVISVLKRETEKKKTIVCTIHQPSSQVFALFDQLYLMAEGGVAFTGPTKAAIAFFEQVGYPFPGNYNPADHYIRVLAVVPKQEGECRKRIKEVCQAYANSELGRSTMLAATDVDFSDGASKINHLYPKGIMKKLKYKATWCQQFSTLMKRAILDNVREPMLLRVRTFQIIIIAILTGCVYLNTPTSGPEYIINVNGVLFQLTVSVTFSFLFGVINTFCDELHIFLREHFSGLYRVDTYFFSKILADMPVYVILPFIFTTIVYWMAGLYRDIWAFLINCAVIVLTANVAISFGYAISCLTANVSIAVSITPVIVVPLMLFGGFYLNAGAIPVYFIWLKYISYFKYSYEALVINQWQHVQSIPGCSITDTSTNETDLICASTGEEVLDSLAFEQRSMTSDIMALIAMIFLIRAIALFALLARTRLKK